MCRWWASLLGSKAGSPTGCPGASARFPSPALCGSDPSEVLLLRGPLPPPGLWAQQGSQKQPVPGTWEALGLLPPLSRREPVGGRSRDGRVKIARVFHGSASHCPWRRPVPGRARSWRLACTGGHRGSGQRANPRLPGQGWPVLTCDLGQILTLFEIQLQEKRASKSRSSWKD